MMEKEELRAAICADCPEQEGCYQPCRRLLEIADIYYSHPSEGRETYLTAATLEFMRDKSDSPLWGEGYSFYDIPESRRNRMRSATMEIVLEEYMAGVSGPKIAEELGISKVAVYKSLAKGFYYAASPDMTMREWRQKRIDLCRLRLSLAAIRNRY